MSSPLRGTFHVSRKAAYGREGDIGFASYAAIGVLMSMSRTVPLKACRMVSSRQSSRVWSVGNGHLLSRFRMVHGALLSILLFC